MLCKKLTKKIDMKANAQKKHDLNNTLFDDGSKYLQSPNGSMEKEHRRNDSSLRRSMVAPTDLLN